MDKLINFDEALEILKSDIFDDDCCYMGAVLFVANAFNVSVNDILERIE